MAKQKTQKLEIEFLDNSYLVRVTKKGDYYASENIAYTNAFELVAKVNQLAIDNVAVDKENLNAKNENKDLPF